MVTLWRAVTTSHGYRLIRDRLQSHAPDDVWYDPPVGWLLAFALEDAGAECVALFVVRQPTLGTRADVIRAMEITYGREQTVVRSLDSV